MKSHNLEMKIVLVGAAGVGKTTLFDKLVKTRFARNYKATVGVDILTLDLEYESGNFVKLSLWDIGGQQRFEFIRSTFYKTADAAIVVFDLTREETLEDAKKWLTEVKQFKRGNDNVPFLLIGNYLHIIEEKGTAIDRKKAHKFAENNGGIYVETSPDTLINLEEALIELVQRVIADQSKVLQYRKVDFIIDLILFNSEIGFKYSLIKNFEGKFTDDHKMTIGASFYVKDIQILDYNANIRLWDTSGERRFRELLVDYCRAKHGALIFFDISSYDTFLEVQEYLEIIRANLNPPPIALIGVNFVMDSEEDVQREIEHDIITNYVKKENINAYFEITARNSIVFDTAIKFITSLSLRNSGLIDEIEFKSVLDKIIYKAELFFQ